MHVRERAFMALLSSSASKQNTPLLYDFSNNPQFKERLPETLISRRLSKAFCVRAAESSAQPYGPMAFQVGSDYLRSKGYGSISEEEVRERQKRLLRLCSDFDVSEQSYGSIADLDGCMAFQVGSDYLRSKGYGSISYEEVREKQRHLLGPFGDNRYEEVDNRATDGENYMKAEDESIVNGCMAFQVGSDYLRSKGYGSMSYEEVREKQRHLLGPFGDNRCEEVDNRANDGGNYVKDESKANGASAGVQLVKDADNRANDGENYLKAEDESKVNGASAEVQLVKEVDNRANDGGNHVKDESKVNGAFAGVQLVKDADNRANDGENYMKAEDKSKVNGASAGVQPVKEVDDRANDRGNYVKDESKVNGASARVQLAKDADNRANDGENFLKAEPNLPKVNGAIAGVRTV